MSGGREAVLARVRAALAPAPEIAELPRAYRQAGALGAGGDGVTVDLFCQRVADYRATVRRVRGDELPGALVAACEQRKARRIAVPAQAVAWTVEGVELVRDDPPLSPRQLDELDGVLSGCALAIAETGTIVLDGVSASGRRALTLQLLGCALLLALLPDAVLDRIGVTKRQEACQIASNSDPLFASNRDPSCGAG